MNIEFFAKSLSARKSYESKVYKQKEQRDVRWATSELIQARRARCFLSESRVRCERGNRQISRGEQRSLAFPISFLRDKRGGKHAVNGQKFCRLSPTISGRDDSPTTRIKRSSRPCSWSFNSPTIASRCYHCATISACCLGTHTHLHAHTRLPIYMYIYRQTHGIGVSFSPWWIGNVERNPRQASRNSRLAASPSNERNTLPETFWVTRASDQLDSRIVIHTYIHACIVTHGQTCIAHLSEQPTAASKQHIYMYISGQCLWTRRNSNDVFIFRRLSLFSLLYLWTTCSVRFGIPQSPSTYSWNLTDVFGLCVKNFVLPNRFVQFLFSFSRILHAERVIDSRVDETFCGF